jgi:predicted RNase H-like HicB family nuclease
MRAARIGWSDRREENDRVYLEPGRRAEKVAMKYAVIFERTQNGWSAHVPDLPTVLVTGPPELSAMRARVASAIAFHVASLREDGEPVPEATTHVEEIEAPAA